MASFVKRSANTGSVGNTHSHDNDTHAHSHTDHGHTHEVLDHPGLFM